MKLTKCQLKGVSKITPWLKTKATKCLSNRIFILTGKAGTGKTTLVKYILEEFIKDKPVGGKIDGFNYPEVLGVAMAHKAKEVLRGSIPDVTTFASYFGFEITHLQNGTTLFEKPYWKKKKTNPCDFNIKFVIHDECSMYDQNMLNTLLSDTHKNTKIILMGDPGQLPPINEDEYNADSPTFIMPIKESSKHHLVERIRQTKNNPIVALSDIIYDEIFGDLDREAVPRVYEAIREQKSDGEHGYDIISQNKFMERFIASSDNYLDSKVIAYRNFAVNDMNVRIRRELFGNITERFVKGDVIILNDTYYHTPQAEQNQWSYRWTMFNSDEYSIIDVIKSPYKDIMCWDLFVDVTDKKHLIGKSHPFIRVVAPEGKNKYKSELERLYYLAALISKNEKKKRAEAFAMYWDFKTFFGNVSYAYCITVYKIQGSTFKTVFIDINDIISTRPISRKRKLQSIYTALTRASHKVTFITQTI